jgi:CMP-N-acetylneuraminic acid synthetase
MNILKDTAWGIITARGGSKSIPLKNIVPVAGKPLIKYTIEAARKAEHVDRLICSTDHLEIAGVAEKAGAEVMDRPEGLSGDLASSLDLMLWIAETLHEREGELAEILVLFQPTSIFITSGNIDAAVGALKDNPSAKSSQCVVKVPHQFHAHNQRQMDADGRDIWFVYQKERERGYSKQTKPVNYTYGNLIVTRSEALLNEKDLFARPSIPVVIPLVNAYDLDGPDDMALAELMLKGGLVNLD